MKERMVESLLDIRSFIGVDDKESLDEIKIDIE